MKRLAVVLAAALIASLAVPVSAANMTIGGALSNEMWYDFEGGPGSSTALELNLNMSLTGGQDIKAVVEFAPIEWAFEAPMGSAEAAPGNLLSQLAINRAYLEASGAYWADGPSVVTRLGDLDIAYSPYVMVTSSDRAVHDIEGGSISGIVAGPVLIDGFYGWDSDRAVRGMRARTEVAGVGIDGTVAKVGEDEVGYAATLRMTPMQNVAVEGTYAGQTNAEGSAIRVGATVGLPFNITANAAYRRTGEDFAPVYADMSDKGPLYGEAGVTAVTAGVATRIAAFDLSADVELLGTGNDGNIDDERSVGVGAATEFAGFDFTAGHKVTQDLNEETTSHKTTLGIGMAEREILPALKVAASYDVTMMDFSPTNLHHVAEASITSDLAMLKGIKVSGRYDSAPEPDEDGNETPRREAKIEYTAPNGVRLGYTCNDLGTNKVSAGMEVAF
ncbi:MAG: hypothetical protein NUW23_03940 [Firmicutes bacterium]|jgi:hypothetical protein|nr:hypothetical protein [Bacillota bacterium]